MTEHHHDHDHDHAGGDSHDHAHGPGHTHAPASFGRAFAIGIALNTVFVIVECVYGVLSGSMALVADAGHNLSDVLGLLVAWVAVALASRPPSNRYTYGFKSSSILAALANAAFLLVACGAIAWEAVMRLIAPEPVAGLTVIIVAIIGIVINGATAFLFMSGQKGDLNIRGAYLHMLADTGVSAGVVVAGLAIMLTGWHWIDPIVSLVIVAVILWSTWGLLRDSLDMSLNAVPPGVDFDSVRSFLAAQPEVSDVHDLHIWNMSTTDTALTAHLVTPGGHPGDLRLAEIAETLRTRFDIDHATLQIETDPERQCALESHVAV